MLDDITPQQGKPSRPLPAANQKAAGFAAFRTQRLKKPRASGSVNGSGSTTAEPIIHPRPKPKGIGRSIKNSPPKALTLHNPYIQANVSHSRVSSVFRPHGVKKRKLDVIEIIELKGDGDGDSVEVLDSEQLRNPGTQNKACSLVRAALAKVIEGEKERLRLETSLRKQITSLESELQQEKKDHDDSKRHLRDLERGLLAAASSMELTNTLIRTTTAQLIVTRDIGRDQE